MNNIPNDTQTHARHKMLLALIAAGLAEVAEVSLTGNGSMEPFDGVAADFTRGDGGRRVHCYQDDEGSWMIDAMDSEVGIPAPAPFSHGLLLSYLVWATGAYDDSMRDLVQADGHGG